MFYTDVTHKDTKQRKQEIDDLIPFRIARIEKNNWNGEVKQGQKIIRFCTYQHNWVKRANAERILKYEGIKEMLQHGILKETDYDYPKLKAFHDKIKFQLETDGKTSSLKYKQRDNKIFS